LLFSFGESLKVVKMDRLFLAAVVPMGYQGFHFAALTGGMGAKLISFLNVT
jgi:hypothetical protein